MVKGLSNGNQQSVTIPVPNKVTTSGISSSNITSSNLNPNAILVTNSTGSIVSGGATTTELGYLSGVTSSIQDQLNNKQSTIIGAASTITSANLTINRAVISDNNGKIAVSSVTSNELGYLCGLTSNVQGQLNTKQSVITGAATTVTTANLTVNRVAISDNNGKIAASTVSTTELGYVSGVTSSIQTQINALQNQVIHGQPSSSSASNNFTPYRVLVSDTNSNIVVSPVSSTELGYLLGTTSSVQNQLNSKQSIITGAATTVTSANLTINKVAISDNNGKIAASTVSTTELGYVSGVTSGIQTQINNLQTQITSGGGGSSASNNFTPYRVLVSDTNSNIVVSPVSSTELGYLLGTTSSVQNQLNSKQSVITGAATTVTSANLTINRVAISDNNGKIAASTVTTTELGYVSGVTSGIQNQINNLQTQVTNVVSAGGGGGSSASNNFTPYRVLVSDTNSNIVVSPVSSTELGYLLGTTSSVQNQLNSKQSIITGAVTTVTSVNLTINKVAISDNNGKIAASTVTTTELGYVSGVTSGIQTQINNLQTQVTNVVSAGGGGGSSASNNFTPYRVLVSDKNSNIIVSPVTSNEVGYLSGVTSSVQNQLDSKQSLITGAATTVTSANLTINRVAISDNIGKIAVSTITSNELSYLSGARSNLQKQLDVYNNAFTVDNNNAVSLSNMNVLGTLSIPGTLSFTGNIGFMGSSVIISASNLGSQLLNANQVIPIGSLSTISGGSFTFATLDANKTTLTINADGIYTLGCIRCSCTASSITNKQYYINRYASDGTTILDQTQPLTAISSVQIGLRTGNKVSFISSPNNINWNANGVLTMWTIIPVTQGFNG